MNAHPIAELLPEMPPSQYQRLVDDISANGLRERILTYDGLILDGRHRWRACTQLGITPETIAFRGDDAAAIALVVSTNLARRHLTPSQLAMVGVAFKQYECQQAHARMVAGGANGGKSRNGKEIPKGPVNLPDPGDARDKAAERVGVSGSMIDRAEDIVKKAVPEIVELVKLGEMTVNAASSVKDMPKSTQRNIAAMPTKQARAGALNRALRKSNAGKLGQARRKTPANNSDVPGSELVRQLLSRLEILANDMDRRNLDANDYAGKFMEEFDWRDPLLIQRFAYVSRALDMLEKLALMGKRVRSADASKIESAQGERISSK